jgi:hypothetical protein
MTIKKELSWEEEVSAMKPEERKSFIHFLGKELTKNKPKTLEDERTRDRVNLVFSRCGFDPITNN